MEEGNPGARAGKHEGRMVGSSQGSLSSGWVQATPTAGFGPRSQLSTAAMEGLLFVAGGLNAAGTLCLSDVWASPNGTGWARLTALAGFGARCSAYAVASLSRLWVFGGYNVTGGSGAPGDPTQVWDFEGKRCFCRLLVVF